MRLIDADALIEDLIERYCKECNKRKGIKDGKWRIIYEIGEVPCRACEVDDVKAELEEAPSVERKKGQWIVDEKRFGNTERHCSSCGAILEGDDWKWRNNNYCYHCGADMRGEQDVKVR